MVMCRARGESRNSIESAISTGSAMRPNGIPTLNCARSPAIAPRLHRCRRGRPTASAASRCRWNRARRCWRGSRTARVRGRESARASSRLPSTIRRLPYPCGAHPQSSSRPPRSTRICGRASHVRQPQYRDESGDVDVVDALPFVRIAVEDRGDGEHTGDVGEAVDRAVGAFDVGDHGVHGLAVTDVESVRGSRVVQHCCRLVHSVEITIGEDDAMS